MFLLIIYVAVIIWFIRCSIGKRSNSLRCLDGKTAIVTGGNAGIGFAISTLLASRGCRVIIADKNNAGKSCDEIKKETSNPNISWKYLNLGSFKSVRQFAEDIQKSESKIDILFNNAGISYSTQFETEDGLNPAMQINFFGAFLLTHLLIDRLKAATSARIIFMGSTTMFFHNLTLQNLCRKSRTISLAFIAERYCNSKLCNVLAAQELGERLKKYGIIVNSADPGFVRTNIIQIRTAPYLIKLFIKVLDLLFARSPLTGAQTPFHLASSEDLEGKTSEHYFLCRKWFKPSILKDVDFVNNIWKQSEDLVQLRPEEKVS